LDLPSNSIIQVKSRRGVLSKVAHKRERFNLGYEMGGFKYQKKKHIVEFVLVGKDS